MLSIRHYSSGRQSSKPPSGRASAEYAMEHFEAEERYMREVGYPQLGEHIQEHREFMRRFSSLVPQWNSEGESSGLLNALLEFLNSWLTEHVSKSDQRIGDFVWNPKA
jgi:hemerythrin